MQRAKHLIGLDAVEFHDRAVYTEKFNVCTKQENLDDPPLRKEIVEFVRALVAAAQRLKTEPELGQKLVAQTANLEIATVRNAWHCFNYPATLARDLLDVFARQEPWIARIQGRAPRNREVLSKLIDDSVVREATRP